ncbi:MAG: hypothetical protein ACOYOI_03585 [Chthoniobacterales bacterium]
MRCCILPGKTRYEPLHFGSVGGGLLGNNDFAFREHRGKPLQHPLGSAQHIKSEFGIGLVQPCGQADAAGNLIQFADGEPLLREDQIGPDHAGYLTAEGRIPTHRHNFRRLTLIQ